MHKIGFLITAYKKKEQLIRQINCIGLSMGYENIYLHIDKKSEINPDEILIKTSHLVNVFKNINVYWGEFSQLLAVQLLIKKSMLKKKYQHLVLMSGQDLPTVSPKILVESLDNKKGKSLISISPLHLRGWGNNNGMGRVEWFWFLDHISRVRGVHRFHQLSHKIFQWFGIKRRASKDIDFYGGSDWWILPGEVALHCAEILDKDRKLRRCFQYSFIPTERFFHTSIMNSKYAGFVEDNNYRFISWAGDNSGHPGVITGEMIGDILSKNVLFARKFDLDLQPVAFEIFERKFLSN